MNRLVIAGRWLMVALLAALCFYRLGAAPLNETDEGFAANRAASFFRHGTFLVSFDDVNSDEPQFRKPPLLYWAVAVCLKTLGHNLWAVRLPTALAGFGCCVLLYLITRRHFGEWVAQLSTLAFAATPFVLWHIRTAMLEMPLLLLILLPIYLLVYAERRPWTPAAAGAIAGLAVLLKGGAGLLAPAGAVLLTLLLKRPFSKALRDGFIALFCSLLPLAIYLALLTPEYRAGFIEGGVVREGAGRWSRVHLDERLGAFAGPLLRNIRWMGLAAAGGLVVFLAGLWRQRSWRGWGVVALLLVIPVILIGVKQVVPYPRYFLPAYPFVAVLAALFCLYAVKNRAVALLLIPFAWWSWQLEATPLRWTPVAAAAVVLLTSLKGCFRTAGDGQRGLVAGLLFAAVVVPSVASARSVGVWPLDIERPMPDVIRLATEAGRHIPEGEKIIAGDGFKLHAVLFYSRRAVVTRKWWLLHDFKKGATRHGIVVEGQLDGIPGLRVEELARGGPWRLVRLAVESDAVGVILDRGEARRRDSEALRLLQAEYQSFDRGLLVTRVAEREDRPLPADAVKLATPQPFAEYVTLPSGESVEWILASPRPFSGVQMFPVKRQERVEEIGIEAWDAGAGAWRRLAHVGIQPEGNMWAEGGRIVEAKPSGARARFEPVVTDRVRLVKTGEHRCRLASVVFMEAASGGSP